ncbi:MAG: MarR family transcriptional regulator [Thermaerobacter sp.]|nr:MarR family transcriptional regulator [Thermaerobacter sp.]
MSDSPRSAADGALVTKREYEKLSAFRGELRRFLRFSEEAARRAGLSPQQHQLLLTIQGMPGREFATIKEIAEHLQVRHHTVVGLVDRMESANLVFRRQSALDHRVVDVALTTEGKQILRGLTIVHKEELVRLTGVWSTLSEIIRGALPAEAEGS